MADPAQWMVSRVEHDAPAAKAVLNQVMPEDVLLIAESIKEDQNRGKPQAQPEPGPSEDDVQQLKIALRHGAGHLDGDQNDYKRDYHSRQDKYAKQERDRPGCGYSHFQAARSHMGSDA
jgi:hypothetical protein